MCKSLLVFIVTTSLSLTRTASEIFSIK